jgi:hypothetical protein
MFKLGDQIQHVDRKEPCNSGLPQSRAIMAAALVCGFAPAGEKWILDCLSGPKTLEEFAKASPEEISRSVRYSMDAKCRAKFLLPGGGSEVIGLPEFLKRIEDEAWCKAHPDHPIAYMSALLHALRGLTNSLIDAEWAPLLQFPSIDGRILRLPQNASPETIAKFMEWYENGWESHEEE